MKKLLLTSITMGLAGAMLVLAADKYELPPETAKLKPGPGAEQANVQALDSPKVSRRREPVGSGPDDGHVTSVHGILCSSPAEGLERVSLPLM